MLVLLRPLVLLAAVLAPLGTPPTQYELVQGSRFWIDGTATTGRWTCEADAVRGHGVVGDGTLAAQVAVPVRDFDCGSRLMNRDLARALDADGHPDIEFTLDHADPVGREPAVGHWVSVGVAGTLRLAGADRRIAVRAEGRRLDNGRVELRGRLPLRMTDFGVRPPSHAGGLIRARDAIVARFTLVAVAR